VPDPDEQPTFALKPAPLIGDGNAAYNAARQRGPALRPAAELQLSFSYFLLVAEPPARQSGGSATRIPTQLVCSAA
jgi:hypothetical protein